jgi:hypothetical protein
MKPIKILSAAFLMLINTHIFAQSKKYLDAMHLNLAIMDTAKNPATFQLLSNSFERIGNAEKDKWLPYYYASFSTLINGIPVQDKMQQDAVFTKAEQLINKADSLDKNNSEIYAMKAFVAQMQIMIDPMTRGQKYGTQASMYLDKAIQLDPNNPRPYYLKGSAAFYTPPQYGGGKDKALVFFQTALDKYATFKPADDLMPHWGEDRCRLLLEQCKQ